MLEHKFTFTFKDELHILTGERIKTGPNTYASRVTYTLVRIEYRNGIDRPMPVFSDRNRATAEGLLADHFADRIPSRAKCREFAEIAFEGKPAQTVRKPAADPNRKPGQGLPIRSLAA